MRFTPHRSLNPLTVDEASTPSGHTAEEGNHGDGGFGVWLPPRSLLLFTGDAYTDFLHGIPNASEDAMDNSVVNWRWAAETWPGAVEAGRISGCNASVTRATTRVSFTCRNVIKLRKLLPILS